MDREHLETSAASLRAVIEEIDAGGLQATEAERAYLAGALAGLGSPSASVRKRALESVTEILELIRSGAIDSTTVQRAFLTGSAATLRV